MQGEAGERSEGISALNAAIATAATAVAAALEPRAAPHLCHVGGEGGGAFHIDVRVVGLGHALLLQAITKVVGQ